MKNFKNVFSFTLAELLAVIPRYCRNKVLYDRSGADNTSFLEMGAPPHQAAE